MLVKITRIGAAPNAGLLPVNWADVVPEEQLPMERSLPVENEIEGTILAPVLPGQQLIAFRQSRGEVSALGIFCTGPVKEILVVTGNAIYRLRELEPSKFCATN